MVTLDLSTLWYDTQNKDSHYNECKHNASQHTDNSQYNTHHNNTQHKYNLYSIKNVVLSANIPRVAFSGYNGGCFELKIQETIGMPLFYLQVLVPPTVLSG